MTGPEAARASPRRRRPSDAVSTFFYRRRRLYLSLLLAPPLLWFGVAFVGALLALVFQSAYTFDDFTMQVTPVLTAANYRALFDEANLDIVIRTVAMPKGGFAELARQSALDGMDPQAEARLKLMNSAYGEKGSGGVSNAPAAGQRVKTVR